MMKTATQYSAFCAQLRRQKLLRQLPCAGDFSIDFSSNDYLGLKQHPHLIQAAITQAQLGGVGSGASRLIGDQQQALKALEKQIAQSKKSQSALIFATGFQANTSILSALLDQKVLGAPPLVFADRLNHASMHLGCQLAKAKQQRFHHGDLDHLRWLLEKSKASTQARFILTESVFGMDGDIADVPTLVELTERYNALLYIDEAHATGLFGQNGYGLSSDFANNQNIISMGTFSKALGGSGAYVACSRALKRYLINRCAGFIYSTAPSPMQVAAMQAAWDLIPSLQAPAQALLQRAAQLRSQLQQLGFNTGLSASHIIPIILNTPEKTLAAQRYLAQQGIRVSAIRPPSVPLQQSRLRVALNLLHTDEEVQRLIDLLGDKGNLFR
jgi:8-amino-7-oxononanoate synthase